MIKESQQLRFSLTRRRLTSRTRCSCPGVPEMYTGRASGSPPQLLHPESALNKKGDPPFPDLVFVLLRPIVIFDAIRHCASKSVASWVPQSSYLRTQQTWPARGCWYTCSAGPEPRGNDMNQSSSKISLMHFLKSFQNN